MPGRFSWTGEDLSPLCDAHAVGVLEAACDDEDEIDQCPYAETANGKEHHNGGSNLADIEAVRAENSDQETQ